MNINYEFETISAIATPLGAGGVGVIRLSGSDAFKIIEKIFSKKELQPGRICHGWIIDNKIKSMKLLFCLLKIQTAIQAKTL